MRGPYVLPTASVMFGMSRRELRFAFVIASTHLIQHFLMRLIPPLIPILAVALEYPLWQLGLLVSVYSFGGGVAQAPIGILADRYDRQYILPTGIVVAGASYVLFASAPAIDLFVPGVTAFGYLLEGGFLVLCVAMFGVGIGAAVVHPTAYPLISANVSEENKGKVLGAFGSASKVGDAAAPAVIGLLILVLVWERIVLLLGFVGVGIGIGLYAVLREDEFTTVPVDYTEPNDESDGDISGNAAQEDNRTYLYPLIVIYVFFITKMVAGNGLNTFVPVFITGVYAYSFRVMDTTLAPESVANFYFAALLLSAAVAQLLLGGVTDRYDSRTVILSCLGVSIVGLLVLAGVELSPGWLLVVLVVLGGSLWGLNPARDALISDITPPEREGRTFGYLWTAVQLTGSVIPVTVGYVIELVGYREGFLVLALGSILAFSAISLLYLDRVYVTDAVREREAEAGQSD